MNCEAYETSLNALKLVPASVTPQKASVLSTTTFAFHNSIATPSLKGFVIGTKADIGKNQQ